MTALLTVIAIAAALRLWGIRFGLPYTEARPDESRIVNLARHLSSGDLNPHYFVYPTLYMYLLAAVFRLQALARGLTMSALPYEDLLLMGRLLTAAFGSATVWIVYWLGKRLGGAMTGLVAAALLAVAFLHVRDSHFATTDVPMTCLVAAATLLLVAAPGRLRDAAAAGVVAGLAMSIKYNAVLLAPAALAIEAHAAFNGTQTWKGSLQRLTIFATCMGAGFLAGTPYAIVERRAFLDGTAFVANYLQSGHVHDGRVAAVPNAARYYLAFALPAGLGWPIYLAGGAGLAWCFRGDVRTALGLTVFPLVYFLTAARGETVFARYLMPVVPFLCVGAGYATHVAARALGDARIRPEAIAALLFAVLAVPTTAKAVRLDRLLATRDNRLVAGEWMAAHLGGRAVCETGSRYGRVHPDSAADRCPDPASPAAYVIVQRSPLPLYSTVSSATEAMLRDHYVLIQSFQTGLGALREQDYDASDAFFIPLEHLEAIRRPGPELDVYELRHD